MYQQEQYAYLNGPRYSMDDDTLTDCMTNDEKEYYKALINSQLSKDERMMGSEVFLEQANSTKPGPIQARVLLLGAFIGIVISYGYLFIRYISAKHLRIKDDLEEVYHCPILGTIEIEKRRPEFLSFIDHWIDSLFDSKGNSYTTDEQLDMICAGIRIAAEKAQMENVYLTGTSNDSESQVLMPQIIDKLAGNISISGGKSVAYDPLHLWKRWRLRMEWFLLNEWMILHMKIYRKKLNFVRCMRLPL